MAACEEFVVAKYSRLALNKLSTEAQILLASHEEALQFIKNAILKKPNVWDRMYKHTAAEERNDK